MLLLRYPHCLTMEVFEMSHVRHLPSYTRVSEPGHQGGVTCHLTYIVDDPGANLSRWPWLRSSGVIWHHPSNQQVLANNSQLKRATGMDVVALCLYCHDQSTDLQHELLGSTCDLRWPWPEVKYWPDPFKVIMYMVWRALTRGTHWCPN